MTDSNPFMTYAHYQELRARYQRSDWKEINMDEPIDHPLRTAVMEAIGAVSECWVNNPGFGPAVLDAGRATAIGNGLLLTITEHETETETVKAAAQAVARCRVFLDLLDRADGLLADGWGHDDPTDPHPVLKRWYIDYRAALAFPPLADIGQLIAEPGS